ncbi:MAG: hypothetical protein D6767_07780 [Candidatus Hydrogenedentota bacterium]|nr:MAG: hypothetical protein D6767_07780 [Candidatus Hydrogenedentota bacterium]
MKSLNIRYRRNRVTIFLALLVFVTNSYYAQKPSHQKTVQESVQESKETKESSKKPKQEPSEFEKLLKKELGEETPEKIQEKQDRPSYTMQFLKTLFTLAILLLIFYGVYKVILFKRQLPVTKGEVFKLLYEYPLMPGKKLQIVEFSGSFLILAVSDAGVQLITEITEKHRIDNIRLDIEKESEKPPADFMLELTKTVKQKVDSWLHPEKKLSTEITNGDLEAARGSALKSLERLKQNKDDLREKL